MRHFKYRGPIHVIEHTLPKLSKLILDNASEYHRTSDTLYNDISKNWQAIYTILLKVKKNQSINETEFKDLKGASQITDFLDNVMLFFRSSTNRMILNAAKRRFTDKMNRGTGFNILPTICEDDEIDQEDENKHQNRHSPNYHTI